MGRHRLAVIAPSPVDVQATMPIPALASCPTQARGHGIGLDEDGYEVCTACSADWPCPAAIR